jgi:hypothetical protein
MHYENRFLGTFRGHSKRPIGFAIVVENVLGERLVLSLLLAEPGPVWLVPPWAKTLHLVGLRREALLQIFTKAPSKLGMFSRQSG